MEDVSEGVILDIIYADCIVTALAVLEGPVSN